VIVESRRELPEVKARGIDAVPVPRQHEIARLGRIDHLEREAQDRLVARLTELVADVRPTNNQNRKGCERPGGG